MDLFFRRKCKYAINDSKENVRKEMESIMNSPWHDFSTNIAGRFRDENSFTITQKWGLAVSNWVESNPAYLKGIITEKSEKTFITITVRPNSGLVLFFYLTIILFFRSLYGIKLFDETTYFEILISAFFSLLFFAIMRLFTRSLKNRFEKLLTQAMFLNVET